MTALELRHELRASPGRFGLIAGCECVEDAVVECERVLGAPRCHVGALLCASETPPDGPAIEAMLGAHPLLVDIEVLFAAELHADPLTLLRRLSRKGPPRVAVWPGRLDAGRATFSQPHRGDHYDRPVDDVVILRPLKRSFADEPFFDVERWSG